MIIETDKAWMAGIVDGEGSIGMEKCARKDRPNSIYSPYVRIYNSDNRTFDLPMLYYGGSVVPYGTQLGRKTVYAWSCPMSSIVQLLIDIRPYLRLKKEQCEVIFHYIERAMDFDRHCKGRVGCLPLSDEELRLREETHTRLKELNKRGGNHVA